MRSKQAWLLPSALLLFAVLLGAKGGIDPDLFWHLRVGEGALGGSLPMTEGWSWIADGRAFYPHSWLHDVLLTLLFRAGGYPLIGLLGLAMVGLAIFLAYRVGRSWHPRSSSVALACSVLLGFFVASPTLSARAQVWDLIFSLLVILIIERRQRRSLILLPLVALLWANLHGAGILAGAIAGGALLLERVVAREWSTVRPILFAGALAALAACLSPLGVGLLAYPIDTLVSPVQQALISEWQPLTVDLAAGSVLLLLILALALGGGQRARRLGPLLLALGWTWMAFGSVRYLLLAGPLLAVAVLPVVIDLLKPRLVGALESLAPRLSRRGAIAPLTALLALSLALAMGLPRLAPAAYEQSLAAYPTGAASYLLEHQCRGRIANNYGWGGYLIWRWGQPVGHYGAADAFGDELLRPYLESLHKLSRDPAIWLNEQRVELALFAPKAPISRWLSAAGWRVLDADSVAVLYAAPGSSPCR